MEGDPPVPYRYSFVRRPSGEAIELIGVDARRSSAVVARRVGSAEYEDWPSGVAAPPV